MLLEQAEEVTATDIQMISYVHYRNIARIIVCDKVAGLLYIIDATVFLLWQATNVFFDEKREQ